MPSGSRDEIIGGGTPTDLPGTVGRLPVYTIGGLNAHISDSIYAQADSGNEVIIGSGSGVNAGQVAGTATVVIGKGAQGWGQDTISIGTNAGAGQGAKQDGAIAIGGSAPTGKNQILISSPLAFGTTSADSIRIGTQVLGGPQNSIAIGPAAGAQLSSIGFGDTASAGEPWSIAIGYHASAPNSGNGTGSKVIAIGYQATAGVLSPGDSSAIAMGRDSVAQGGDSIAIGRGASVTNQNSVHSIALGHGATVTTANTFIVGDSTNGPINKVGIRTTAATALRHGAGASGEFIITDPAFTSDLFVVDTSAVAGDIRLKVYDVTAALLKRVTMAAAGAAPAAGFRALQVPV